MKLQYELPWSLSKSKNKKTYRNPIIYARELQAEMRREGLTQTEFAMKLGISRARVNQWLSLLSLPERSMRMIRAMGDNWERQLITERQLRKILSE